MQFKVRSVHLPGSLNRLPDLLSRWHEGVSVQEELRTRGGDKLKRKNVPEKLFEYTHDW